MLILMGVVEVVGVERSEVAVKASVVSSALLEMTMTTVVVIWEGASFAAA
jgi:hypothetical protein